MSVLLFGKRAPKLVDKRKHPKLRKGLARLEDMKEHISLLMGRQAGEFSLELCEGDNAFVSRDGQVAFGVELLEEHQEDSDLLLGVLGHEMGHQPWDWPTGDMSTLTKAQLDALYREEEAKADRFAGKVLAELGASPESIERFLLTHAKGFEEKQSNDYYPVGVRIAMIRKAFDRKRRSRLSYARILGI